MPVTIEQMGWDPTEERERKRIAYERLQVLEGMWKYLVVRKLTKDFEDPPTRARVVRHASVALNIARGLMEPVSNAYNTPPRRFLARGRGRNQRALKLDTVYRDLVGESRIRVLAPDWNLRANYVGLVAVAPVYRRDAASGETKLTLESYYPHQLDFQWGPNGIHQPPVAALITIYRHRGTTDSGRVSQSPYTEHGLVEAYDQLSSDVLGYVHVDAERWMYFDAGGVASVDLAVQAGGATTLSEIQHDLGELPLTVFTTGHGALDWWNAFRAQGLHDATLDAACIYATMRWVRKAQNRRVATYGFTDQAQDGDIDDDGSVLDPETPVRLKPTETFNTYSLDTSPEGFIKDIRFILDTQADAFGIPSSDVGLESNGSDLAVTVRQTRLTALRTKQVPFFMEAEADLWSKAWRLGAKSTHEGAAQMRRNETVVDDSLRVEFPELNLADDPVRREQVYKLRLSRGGTNPIEQIQIDQPHLTFQEAQEQFEENLAVTRFANEQLARIGGASAGATTRFTQAEGVQSSAQETGRVGGQMSPGDGDDESEEA